MTKCCTEPKIEIYLATSSFVLFLLHLSLVTISENDYPDLVLGLKIVMIFVSFVIMCVHLAKIVYRRSTSSCIENPHPTTEVTPVVQRLERSGAYQSLEEHDEVNDQNNREARKRLSKKNRSRN